MQDKNSNPDNEFSKAKLETFLSKIEAPAIIVFGSNSEMWEKNFPNFIITPLNPPSLTKVLDPAPKILIFSAPFTSFKKIDNSCRFFGLNKIFAGPPKLNHESLDRLSLNEILPEIFFFIFFICGINIIVIQYQFPLSNLKYCQHPYISPFHHQKGSSLKKILILFDF